MVTTALSLQISFKIQSNYTFFVFLFQAEDDGNILTYSEMDFSNRAAGSSSRALHGHSDNVVYSVPHVARNSGASRAEDNSPVYSTVT